MSLLGSFQVGAASLLPRFLRTRHGLAPGESGLPGSAGQAFGLPENLASALPQAVALPYRVSEAGKVEVLLISSQGARWSLPRAPIVRNVTGAYTAAIEAEETAGVRGIVVPAPMASFASGDSIDDPARPVTVHVHLLRVTEVLDDWKEHGGRGREWFAAERAHQAVEEELRPVLKDFSVAVAAPRHHDTR